MRSVLAAVGVSALVLALLPLGSAAQGVVAPPDERDDSGGGFTTAQADSPIQIDRLFGPTRFQTAAQIATNTFTAATDVVIATGEEYPDALAGASLEGDLESPVLLTPSDLVAGSIPDEITDAIDELGATNAVFLGGDDAISDAVEDHIVDNSTVVTTERVDGPTRFETAEEIANRVSAGPVPQAVQDEFDLTGQNAAFLATGLNWPDALAGGPGAYEGSHPILLTTEDELHDAAERGLQASGADVVFILGGTDVVSSDVESELQNQGYETERFSGADRWGTAVEVAEAFVHQFGYGESEIGLATGFEFADALASAPFLGETPGPLMITPTNATQSTVEDWFDHIGCSLDLMTVFGGEAAVQQSVAEQYAETACPAEDAITGTVTNAETGEPIEGATVEATNSNTFSTTTDEDGEYTLQVDTPETYTVTADADGFQSETEEDVQVDEGDVVTVDFELSPIGDLETLSLSPQEATNPTTGLDEDGVPDDGESSEHTTTASLTDANGNAVGEGADVRFEVYDRDFQEQEPFDGGIRTADENGEATFTYEFETNTVRESGFDGAERSISDGGDDIVVACVVPDSTTPCVEDDQIDFDPITGDVRNITQEPNDTAEKMWEPREVDALVLDEQTSTVNLSEETHTVTGQYVDQFGDPDVSRDGEQVHRHLFDEDDNLTETQSTTVDGHEFSFTYTGPTVPDEGSRETDRIVVCEDADHDNCIDNGNLADDVLADEVFKDWVEVTEETTVQLNWQNEFREDENAWGGVDDFAAEDLDNNGNGTIDVRFNSDLGVVSTHGWVNVSSEIPDDGNPAGPNFHLHSGAIDAEGPVEIGLVTPQLVDEPDDDRGEYTYDLTGTVQDEDASGELQDIEDQLDAGAFSGVSPGDVIDWYLNVHTVDNPAGEVRGQLQAGDPGSIDVDGGLSEIPSIYEFSTDNAVFELEGETVTAVDLNFEASIESDPDDAPLIGDDFTVTVNGNEADVFVVSDDQVVDNEDTLTVVIDEEVEDGDNVTAVFEDSGREKVRTDTDTEDRDGQGDGDLLRSWDVRSFEVDGSPDEGDAADFPQP